MMGDPPPDSSYSPSLPYLVVGVGASAGGLQALLGLFGAVDPKIEAAFVVVQHLSPDFESMMVPLLDRNTQLNVETAVDGSVPTKGRIHLLPPGHDIIMQNGRLRLLPRSSPAVLHLPIDQFLHSLAAEQGEMGAGVILSGTGSDGSRGLVSIRQHGGIVLVQAPESAEFDGMPKAALATGLTEFEGTPPQLAAAIDRRTHRDAISVSEAQPAFMHLVDIMRQNTGMDLAAYREGTLLRRLQRRMVTLGTPDLETYVQHLRSAPAETHRFKQEMLIAVTAFFRDEAVWEYLKRDVVPGVLERAGRGAIRAWVAGCSTGEEAYSLAILLFEACRAAERSPDFKIFATDLDAQALKRASEGEYPTSAVAGLPSDLVDRYFEERAGGYTIRRMVRERLTFATHNLLSDPPFTRIDIATCRNVLIYLKPSAQVEVLARFHFGLVSRGILVLGDAESVGDASRHFKAKAIRHRVFQATADGPAHQTMLRGRTGRSALPTRATSEVETINAAVARRFAPPGVATDTTLEVLHIFGDVTPYMSIPEGQVTTNLQRMIAPAASVLLTSAATRALETGETVVIPGLSLGADVACDITVSRFPRRSKDDLGLLIFFERPNVDFDSETHPVDVDEAVAARLSQLDTELQKTRAHLRSAVEELETSNEELQATNEELVASNEELQSTNEEMQSVNEELFTVNAEYQQKISELGELSDDLDHLLHNLEAGTIFLDNTLAVRRFNALATSLAPLIDADLGRPVTDLAWRVDPEPILQQVHAALAGRETVPQVVRQADGRSWRVLVRAYRRRRDADLDGALLTIVDVTDDLALSKALQDASDLMVAASQLAQVGMMVLDKEQMAVEINGASKTLLGLADDAVVDYQAVVRTLAGADDGGPGERTLKLGSRKVALRVFVRPTTNPHRIMIAFQTLSPLTGSV